MRHGPRIQVSAAAARRVLGTLALTPPLTLGLALTLGLTLTLGLALTLPLALSLALPAGPAQAADAAVTRPAGFPTGAAAALQRLKFGVRLVDVPVDEENNPRALRYIIDFLPTGSVIHRRIMIINDEPRTARFTVYPGAAQITGGMFIGAAGNARNELTGWITVRHPSVILGPGKSATDQVTIRVPRGATRAEHYAVIWTEQSVPARSAGHGMIRVTARVGIRVYLAVGRGGVPPTRFTNNTRTPPPLASGQPMLIAHVRSTGGRAVDLAGQLRLTGGPGGTGAGPFSTVSVITLAPGQSGNVAFELPANLPNGPWHATVRLASGLTSATARATVSFGPPVIAASSWASPVTLAWGGGMLLGLSVIGTVAAVRIRRPRRSPA